MRERRPGLDEPRFVVELAEDGRIGIRDRASGILYLTTGLADADRDVAYLHDRTARGDEAEVLRHLTYNDETARRVWAELDVAAALPAGEPPLPVAPAVPGVASRPSVPPVSGPGALQGPPLLDLALSQAERWSATVAAVETHAAAQAHRAALPDAIRSLEAHQREDTFAGQRLADAARVLYPDPDGARSRIAEHIASVGYEQTIAILSDAPETFGQVAQLAPAGFGALSQARAVRQASQSLAAALAGSIRARLLLDQSVRAAHGLLDRPPPTADSTATLQRLREALSAREPCLPAPPDPEAVTRDAAALRASLARLPLQEREAVVLAFPRAQHIASELARGPRPSAPER